MSIAFPPSNCPHCGHPIAWYDNIPLISYIVLRGRCRHCGAKISVRYPIVELLSGLLFLFSYLAFGISTLTLRAIVAGWLSLGISWIDWEHGLVPDSLTLSGTLIGLAIGLLEGIDGARLSVVGLSIGLAFGLTLRFFGRLIARREAFGEGDITYLTMLGSLMGPFVPIAGLFLGSILGLLWVGLYFIVRKEVLRAVKFCPFIALGALVFVVAARLAGILF